MSAMKPLFEGHGLRIESLGHALFAVTLIVLGITALASGHFSATGQYVPRDFPARDVLNPVCALVAILCGLGLLSGRWAASASGVLFAYLLLRLLLIKLPPIIDGPAVEVHYQSAGETEVMVAAAWVLFAGFAAATHRRWLGFVTGEDGVHLARVLYALALIAFGFSHFAYLNLTLPLIPAWLPAHLFWAYFTGSAYLAAAVAILAGVFARLATALSALQMGLFTLLVWVPLAATGHMGPGQWGELSVSWALTVAGWVVADSFRGKRWLAIGTR